MIVWYFKRQFKPHEGEHWEVPRVDKHIFENLFQQTFWSGTTLGAPFDSLIFGCLVRGSLPFRSSSWGSVKENPPHCKLWTWNNGTGHQVLASKLPDKCVDVDHSRAPMLDLWRKVEPVPWIQPRWNLGTPGFRSLRIWINNDQNTICFALLCYLILLLFRDNFLNVQGITELTVKKGRLESIADGKAEAGDRGSQGFEVALIGAEGNKGRG